LGYYALSLLGFDGHRRVQVDCQQHSHQESNRNQEHGLGRVGVVGFLQLFLVYCVQHFFFASPLGTLFNDSVFFGLNSLTSFVQILLGFVLLLRQLILQADALVNGILMLLFGAFQLTPLALILFIFVKVEIDLTLEFYFELLGCFGVLSLPLVLLFLHRGLGVVKGCLTGIN